MTRTWDEVFRLGICPSLPTVALEALAVALEGDDARLVQMAICEPSPPASMDCQPEAADAVAFCFWQGWGLTSVRRVEAAWGECMYQCSIRLVEPAACVPWINWHDETPRAAMFAALAVEVRAELRRRASQKDAAALLAATPG
jgi:hypothetical protein